MDVCEECGFDFDAVGVEEIGERSRLGASAIAGSLITQPEVSVRRPTPDRWSMVEYGAHVRDVMLTVRDRLVIGLVEDNPAFKPLYREERINLGLYRTDPPVAVAKELEAAAEMFVRLFGEIDGASLERPAQYGFPGPVSRTLLWMGKQVVHETEHHLGDIRENALLLTA